MRRLFVCAAIALAVAACGTTGGGAAPAAPAGGATEAPKATDKPMPSSNPYVDNYGY